MNEVNPMISLADLHCDTLYKCFINGLEPDDKALHINTRHIRNLRRYIQVFAHYIPEQTENKWDFFVSFLKNSRAILEKANISVFNSSNDLKEPYLAVFSVEGGDLFADIYEAQERIPFMRQCGISLYSMIYNGANALGSGCAVEDDRGLTDLGKEVVSLLEQNQIILDVSHASFRSTQDILNCAKRPVCATHSNAAALTKHRRNLCDDHLRAIADSGGLVGVNFYPPFLSQRSTDVSDICRHIDYMIDLCGENAVSFGCDFDGVDVLPKGIDDLSSLEYLYREMSRLGYNGTILDKLFFDNILVFIKENFGR